jgi:carbon-monoxide dehydrogenase medium subunit
LLALDGVVLARGPQGERRIPAQDFFTGLYSTELQEDEVIVACEIPLKSGKRAFAFDELARRHGDYAVVGVAMTADVQGNTLRDVRLAWLGAACQPLRSQRTEAVLEGQAMSEGLLAQALQCLKQELPTEADLTHSAATKSHLAGVMLKRAIKTLTQPQANPA